jgi:hypothetical protein
MRIAIGPVGHLRRRIPVVLHKEFGYVVECCGLSPCEVFRLFRSDSLDPASASRGTEGRRRPGAAG